jgi:hypothetical protein
MRAISLVFAVLVLWTASVGLGRWLDQGGQATELTVLSPESWDRVVPEGKEVDAIYGDLALTNAYLSAVVAQPLATRHANMTTKDVAGGLIDLADAAAPSDQLAVFLPGRRTIPYRSATTSDDGLAVTVSSVDMADKPTLQTEYRFDSQHPRFLRVSTVYRNAGSTPLTITLEDDFRADGGKEMMRRSADGVTGRFWLEDRFWHQAYAVEPMPGRQIQVTSDARNSVLKYVDSEGNAQVTLPPGESFTLQRWLTAARQLPAVWAACQQRAGQPIGQVSIQLRDADQRPVVNPVCEFLQGDVSLGTATGNAEGVVALLLPAGEYRVRMSSLGRSLGDDQMLSVAAGDAPQRHQWSLPDVRWGQVTVTVRDGQGQGLPCKVSLQTADDQPPLQFGPDTAEFGIRHLRYTPHGDVSQVLPPGRYTAVISHGPEYDRVVKEFTIEPAQSTTVQAVLDRTVDTTGWISSDFHSHASPSGDNSTSQLGRVLNLAAEHIEFAPCTEHNRVSSYVPHIERLRLQPFLATIEGIELTGSPLPLNHQNAFPMRYVPRTQDGGAPVAGPDLESQIERLALWDGRSDKLLQVNHPDLGWMFYDKNGDGEPDEGYSRAFPWMEVVEIHPPEAALDLQPTFEFPGGQSTHNPIFRWLQLLNQGYRIYGVVNTDAHDNYHGSGPLRNWIQSSTDLPSEIQPLDVVHAAEQGRLVMSNGPFLEVWATAAANGTRVTAGQDLPAPDGKVSLSIRVQCPNWLDVDRVDVLVNGRRDPDASFSRGKQPQMFRSGVVKVDQTVSLQLPRDAHLVVVTGHPTRNLRAVYEDQGAAPPAALSNPIFVDVGDAGFVASKDTLDAPLPLKFAPRRP